ncbi:DUF1311 domain-containing protein [Rhizobium sp. CFBP 8762]|uniref:lysozyme inhibitor LprI family protein n=1 Tax=Rhizobium sp. CFBP 8762 TaxID=2775279 RepID=UPI00177EFB00|nr:lysozyme inhibitor LprI family protein [Rhizobium sp. CFBP 8762]MBD8556601.1 DUF1311 domain-containing protein [Rhizobium sp. CFBP 8762]
MIGWLCRAVLIVGVCFGSPAFAEEKLPCTDKVTTYDIKMCLKDAFEQADADLNRAYKALRQAAEEWDAVEEDEQMKGAVKALIAAQRAWIVYRDQNCIVEGFRARGGSLESVFVTHCEIRLTKVRTKEMIERVTLH